MPQLQNLILTDRAATPVAHTFVPREKQGSVGTVAESTGTPIGDPKVTVSMVRTASGKYKGVVKYTFPVVQTQTINGVSTPVVVRTAYGELTVTFNAESTTQERNNAIGMIADSLGTGKALINGALVNLEGVW